MRSHLLSAFAERELSIARLRTAVEWLVNNHRDIEWKEALAKDAVDDYKYPNGFEFPDYMGMPKLISKHLFSDDVNWIQENIDG